MHHILDVKNLLCPLPVIRLSQMVEKIAVGDTIELIATDRGTLHDIPAWCSVHKHQILNSQQTETEIVILVKKIS